LPPARAGGRRHSTVVVAEGARDRNWQSHHERARAQGAEERLGEDVRVTILGHIQRGRRAERL